MSSNIFTWRVQEEEQDVLSFASNGKFQLTTSKEQNEDFVVDFKTRVHQTNRNRNFTKVFGDKKKYPNPEIKFFNFDKSILDINTVHSLLESCKLS